MDFESFVLTGPSTVTTSSSAMTAGAPTSKAGLKVAYNLGTCATDMFTVSGNTYVPPLCSTLTGDHGNLNENENAYIFSLAISNLTVCNISK